MSVALDLLCAAAGLLSDAVLRDLLCAVLLPTGLLPACVLQARDLLPEGLLSPGVLLRDEDGLLSAASFLLQSGLHDSVLLYRTCTMVWPGNLNSASPSSCASRDPGLFVEAGISFDIRGGDGLLICSGNAVVAHKSARIGALLIQVSSGSRPWRKSG